MSSEPPCKNGNARFTIVPLKRSKIWRRNFCREPANENEQFQGTKTLISVQFMLSQILVNRALPSLHVWSLEFTLTDM